MSEEWEICEVDVFKFFIVGEFLKVAREENISVFSQKGVEICFFLGYS